MGWNPEIGIPLAIAGLFVLALVYYFGRPRRPDQGRRTGLRDSGQRDGERVEPTLGEVPEQGELDVASLEGVDVDAIDDADRPQRPPPADPQRPAPGMRPNQAIDRIVTLFVSARAGE